MSSTIAAPLAVAMDHDAPTVPALAVKEVTSGGVGLDKLGEGDLGADAPSIADKVAPKLTKGELLLQDLLQENASFVSGEPKIYPNVPKERSRLASEGQTPVAAVIACADSRVAPEIIFRANLGNLFVIRAAGNTAWGSEVLGSLEYAVDHLNVDLVMVLGHTKCGAVGAACAGGDPLPGALGKHITSICKGIERNGGLTKDVDLAVERNVACQVEFLRKDSNGCIPVAEKRKGMKVVGAVYDIQTGLVRVLDGCQRPIRAAEVKIGEKRDGGCSIM